MTVLTRERGQFRLELLVFSLTYICENGFAVLLTFKEREKHCRVSQTYKEGGYKLGIWVAIQRSNKDKLTQERRQRLDNIDLVWTVKK